jgi:hypothetical protein
VSRHTSLRGDTKIGFFSKIAYFSQYKHAFESSAIAHFSIVRMLSTTIVQPEAIAEHIYFVRGEKIMLDADLAALYGTETKALKRAVRRNIKRFLPDFMFELTKEEFEILRYQFGTSKTEPEEQRGGTRYMPFAFT